MSRALVFAACLAVACTPAGASRHHRSHSAKAAFARQHPCPSTGKPIPHCPGYVIDHIDPLECGGPDAPSNMQWQTIADGKAKDRWERDGCKDGRRL